MAWQETSCQQSASAGQPSHYRLPLEWLRVSAVNAWVERLLRHCSAGHLEWLVAQQADHLHLHLA